MMASLLILALSAPASADVPSGPAVGEKVAALTVYAVTGDATDKEVDYAARRGEKPTVYLFINAEHWDRPMARFVRDLDAVVKNVDPEAALVAVWLTSEVEAGKAYLPRAQMSLKLQSTSLVVYPGEKTGPGEWGVNSDAHLTAVVVNKSKTAATFGYVSVNETVVPEVEKALMSAVK